MIRCILIFLVSVFITSCKESLPSNIIKQKKMQEVLWDVFRADALSRQIVSTDSSKSLQEETIKLTEKVFLIHNITKEQFEKSYSYYAHHPDIMKTILDSLNAQQTRISNIELTHRNKQLHFDSTK
jgi:hypothetical protein